MQAVLFDMDGVLIDSEPLWKIAEIKAFETVGIKMTIDMCNLTMGYRTSEVIDFWYERTPWVGKSKQELLDILLTNVMNEIRFRGKEMKGVRSALKQIKAAGLKTAVASSSSLKIIDLVLDKLEIRDLFDAVCSAEFEEFGKPHPAVFIQAAKKLNTNPLSCLVIEDSVNGVIAGKAAKMKVIAIPEETVASDKRFGIADRILPSLEVFKVEEVRKLFI